MYAVRQDIGLDQGFIAYQSISEIIFHSKEMRVVSDVVMLSRD